LHIGLSKTGTTAFQGFLATNSARLGRHGVGVTKVLRGPRRIQLAAAFAPSGSKLSLSTGVQTDAAGAELRTRLRMKLRREASSDQIAVISCEQLSSMVRRPTDLKELADVLHEIYDLVSVLAVVRRGDYWLPSTYAEAVLAGYGAPMDGHSWPVVGTRSTIAS